MMKIDSTTWREARRALEKAAALYLDDPNVSLIDLGFRTRSSQEFHGETELVVRVHVRQKFSGKAFRDFAAAEPHRVIETQRVGFAVEVVEAAYHLHLHHEAPRHERQRGRHHIAGGKVRDRQSGEEMILTSWHAAESYSTGKDFPIGRRNAINAGLDAAVIEFDGVWHRDHPESNAATGVALPQLGMRVIKPASPAGATFGIITGILGYMRQRDAGSKRIIGPLVHITPETPTAEICAPGDSGSWWLESSTRRVVALHFAGSKNPNFALALSMPEVLAALGIDIVDTTPSMTCSANLAPKMNYHLLPAGLALIGLIAILGFDRHLTKVQHQQDAQIDQLKKELQYVKAIAQVDSVHEQQRRRLVAIIDRFNPEMNAKLKFNLAAEIYAMSLKYRQLDVALICATITHETGRTWNPEAVSFAGALGLMQILPSTGIMLAQQEGIAWTAAEEILFNPIYNVRLGCRYLATLVTDYGLEAGLAGYNGGDRQAKRWRHGGGANSSLHPETAYYVPAILKIYREYRQANL